MNRRKIKKAIKKVPDIVWQKQALVDIRAIRFWEKLNHPEAKACMRVLTRNFWLRGQFYGVRQIPKMDPK